MEKKSIKSFGNEFVGLGQRLGKAILLPIAILPVAGLLLGVSAALSSGATIQAYKFLDNQVLQTILLMLNSVGKGVFTALPLIFAVGIAIGLAKGEKGAAGLAAVVGYFVLLTSVSAYLKATGKMAPAGEDVRLYGQAVQYGIHTLNMNVFGGIITGIVTAIVHNRYYKIRLPEFLAFFGGARFVPIVNTVVFMVVGFIMFLVWPQIANLIAFFGSTIQNLGLLGSFLYGLLLRTFYVFGLHHVFYLPFWTTAAGGVLEVNGVMVEGWQQIFLAQLADPNTTRFYTNVGLYNSGRYLHMLFGLPAACLAMYHTISDKKKRKATAGFLISIALTCIITGVTEPISFAFLFANPILFVVEAVLFASSFLLASIFNVVIGSTFSAGIIEFLLFGVFQGNAKTGFVWILVLGIPTAIVYYYIYKFLIIKLNAKTPGRDDDNSDEETSLKAAYQSGQAKDIIEAFGGLDNIVEIDNCATRLRVTVKKVDKIEKDSFKATGAHNVIVRGKYIQVIYGPTVNIIRTDIDEYIEALKK